MVLPTILGLENQRLAICVVEDIIVQLQDDLLLRGVDRVVNLAAGLLLVKVRILIALVHSCECP